MLHIDKFQIENYDRCSSSWIFSDQYSNIIFKWVSLEINYHTAISFANECHAFFMMYMNTIFLFLSFLSCEMHGSWNAWHIFLFNLNDNTNIS